MFLGSLGFLSVSLLVSSAPCLQWRMCSDSGWKIPLEKEGGASNPTHILCLRELFESEEPGRLSSGNAEPTDQH